MPANFTLCDNGCSHPTLTQEAASFISSKYAELRGKETESKTLPVTARTLETMIRLSTALAKCRLSPKIEKADAEVRSLSKLISIILNAVDRLRSS